jgi:hypothetical protein
LAQALSVPTFPAATAWAVVLRLRQVLVPQVAAQAVFLLSPFQVLAVLAPALLWA